MKTAQQPIGVFDSGVGGISVLKKLTDLLPNENFIYFGDSANAPYGTKTDKEVFDLTQNAVRYFLTQNVKALVIACNTATAAAAAQLRQQYNTLPIIGMEPAIKPAAYFKEHPTVLVLATPMTLRLEKFIQLAESLSNKADFIPLPCPHLVELIEAGKVNTPECREYLTQLLQKNYIDTPDAVVLGCTHFPFAKKILRSILGNNIAFFDGAEGTARQLQKKLAETNLLCGANMKGTVIFKSSDPSGEKLILMQHLYHTDL